MITANTAKELLKAHGFTVHHWDGYTIRRDIPAYSSSPDWANDQRLRRDFSSFHASKVSLHWLRKLAVAIDTANTPGLITSKQCAEGWAQSKRAKEEYESAEWMHNYGEKYCAEQWSQRKRDDLGVAAIRAEGSAKVAAMVIDVLMEAWALEHPIKKMGS